MPRFIGSFVSSKPRQTAFAELYEFSVVAPADSAFDIESVLPAFVTPELDESHIAQELAHKYGALRSGETIEVTLQEVVWDGTDTLTSRFNLPIVVNFATKNRGSNYVQIGLADLQEHFGWKAYSHYGDDFMEITRKTNSSRECEDDREASGILTTDS